MTNFKLQVLSHRWEASKVIRRFRAPSRKQYLIHGMLFVNMSATNNQIAITDGMVEEKNLVTPEQSFVMFDTSIDGNMFYVPFNTPKAAKYLTAGVTADAVVTSALFIYYTLAPLSIEEAVLEFVKRGKNP